MKEALGKVDLTPEAAEEMLEDAGVTLSDVLDVAAYILFSPQTSAAREPGDTASEDAPDRNGEGAHGQMRYYERRLADWLLTGGLDAAYDKWGM